ncbi:RNA polymerase II mediator complex component SRB4 [Moelleriella libera RCEF 2490]|uniref:Mediator of RNA polymerase II transcription subunit 17 n=1 Tax=Moelleriella libera RCEF 2490 TaxID=1081109 RepID=A0A162IM48_9HYPO|nr:RNA polymerase II mediator complex component SRB4 [Moelleriella libera RCEF 2490]
MEEKGPPLSLRPFPIANREPKDLAEFIARVNTQPGGFRALSVQKLRDDIVARDSPNAADSDQDDGDVSDGGGGGGGNEEEPARDPILARAEVLKNIEIAGNTAMLTLDSLSLLLSKQSPTQAGLTLSQQLREMVGIGTLGADRLDEPMVNPHKAEDEEEVALGWTLMQINETRDAAEAAGKLLQREVEAESKYWEDVVAVKRCGWSICRVPRSRDMLGVRFGFSEAAADFKNNGSAPMKRGDGGSVELDLGRLGGVSEGLAVSYERDGKLVGRSVLRPPAGRDNSLEAKVLEARNTIFSQELWHELGLEARTLAGYGVRRQGSKLTWPLDTSSRITLELVPLDSDGVVKDEEALPESYVAEGMHVALHVLLSYAHRYNELMRTRPMPSHISRTRGQQVYALLRPIIARMTSISNMTQCASLLGDMTGALERAGFSPSFVLKTAPYSTTGAQGPNQPGAAQALVRSMLLQPIEFHFDFTVTPQASLTIRGRTFLFPVTTTVYHVLLPAASPLHATCAPCADGEMDVRGLSDYLRAAVGQMLAHHFVDGGHEVHFSVEGGNDHLADGGFVVAVTAVTAGQAWTAASHAGKKSSWSWSRQGPSESRSMEQVVMEATSLSL